MRPLRACPAAVALIVSAVGAASRSSGQAPSPSVGIEYLAPAECPGATSFLDEIRKRTSRVSVHESGAGAGGMQISIAAREDRFIGSLMRRSANGGVSTRSLEAASCVEVASALALIAALALDPDADTSASPATVLSTSTPEPVPSASPSIRVAGATSESAAAPVNPPHPRHPIETQPDRSRASWWLGAHWGMDLGTVAPGTTFDSELSILVAWRGARGGWSPAVRLSGYYAPREYEGDVGRAKLRWYGARMDACAFFPRFGGRIEAAPCAQVGAGALHAEGIAERPKESARAWVDIGLSARGRLLLTSWLAIELQAGLVAPLTRPTLEFVQNDEVLYRVPPLGGRFSLGVAGKIP